MKYQIRPMEIKDIEAVIAGEEAIFGESLGYDMLYSELTLNPYAYYFILEIDRKVAGYIGVWIEEERSEIINFYILEKHQNNGFGRMMLEFVMQLCEMSGVENLSLEVRKSNQRAIHLYESFGLKYSHERKQYYKDSEDALVLIKHFEVQK